MLIVINFFVTDQSELDSPERDSALSSSSELEEEPEELELTQSCHWSVQKKCGTCFLCSVAKPLAFSSHSICLDSENR